MTNVAPIRQQSPLTGSVLLVEEDTELAPVLHGLLAREGYAVIRAADGRQAEQLIHRLPPPDVVLLETFLPYRGGFELLRRIRELPAWDGVRVLMLSNNASGADAARARAGGAEACLVKPLCPESLLLLIARCEWGGRALPRAARGKA